MQTTYPIRAVAKITGISLDTLRAWERRYKAVVPERSERGRMYSGADIERLYNLNRLVQNGHAIGGIASLSDQELKNLLSKLAGVAAPEPATSTDLLVPILSAIENYDSGLAGDELSRLAALLNPRDLVYQVAVPLMHEIGARWHDGTLAIAQEHLVSELLRNLLGSLMRVFRPSKTAMKMVFATPAGESHDFGILDAAMLASIAGVEPVFLGANLPAGEIATAARRVSADVVVLGVTVVAENTAGELRDIAESMPEVCELWIGGAGSSGVDLSSLDRRSIVFKDLPAFEDQCRRRSR